MSTIAIIAIEIDRSAVRPDEFREDRDVDVMVTFAEVALDVA